ALEVHLDVDGRQAALKARQVAVHAKWFAVIGRHHIVNAIAKDKASIQHRDLGVAQTYVLAVKVNNTVVIDIGNHALHLTEITNGFCRTSGRKSPPRAHRPAHTGDLRAAPGRPATARLCPPSPPP